MPRLGLALSAIIVVAACGGAPASGGATREPDAPQPTPAASPVATPSGASPSAPAASSAVPSASPDDAPSADPAPSAGAEPTSASGTTAPAVGGAAACSGNDQNRAFFEGIAAAVDWPVLCGVLPRGWFVAEGSYRLANGGRLVISYKGPAGARLTLSEGAYCTDGDCVPDGTDLGAAALGPLAGILLDTGDGYAVVVAPGENPAWLLETTGLDRATTESLAAALGEVGR